MYISFDKNCTWFNEGALYLWRKGGKAQKAQKSGGKPENGKISAENVKLFFKTAEMGNHF